MQLSVHTGYGWPCVNTIRKERKSIAGKLAFPTDISQLWDGGKLVIIIMEYKQKSEQFRISIRRKNLDQKMAAMRAKQSESYALQDPQAVVQQMKTWLNACSSNLKELYGKTTEIKMASADKQVMGLLVSHFELFYRGILQVDSMMQGSDGKQIDRVFIDLATILINITSEQFINVSQINEDVATPLLLSISKPQREISVLWLVANILYRHNALSAHFTERMAKWGAVEYLRNRLNLAFASETQMTIFYYFVGAYAASLDALPFPQYKSALELLQFLANVQVEELYWYLLDGLIQHALFLGRLNYQLFGTKILFKCEAYCKGKKSRFVIKYLEMVAQFLRGESQILAGAPEQQQKKVLSEQYERTKNNGILKNLQFCLQNRSPQVKRLLFENGYMLVALYKRQISFIDEYFYFSLAEQMKSVQKYEERVVVWFLKYFNVLLGALLIEGSVVSQKEYTKQFVNFVEKTEMMQKVASLLDQFNRSLQVIDVCMEIIGFLLDYDIPEVNAARMRVNLVPALENLEIEVMAISNKRDKLLDVLCKEMEQ